MSASPYKQLEQEFRRLHAFRGALSLELFNQDYYRRDPLAVAREGLEKTKAAVTKAGFPSG